MIMSGFVEKEMIQQRMAMAGGKRFQVNSNGISDTRISGLIKLLDQKTFKTHLGIGISLMAPFYICSLYYPTKKAIL